MFSNQPKDTYYAVIFTSIRTKGDQGYAEMADRMIELARQQPGFIALDSARNKEKWYQSYSVRICKVEREYCFEKAST